MTPRVALATLAINEMEWLPRLYAQHWDWPGLVRWTFVEAADPVYAAANPDMVSHGLSVDGTGAFLDGLARGDRRVTYWPVQLPACADPAQGKCAARTMTLRDLDDLPGGPPDWVVVLDADEFYTREDQRRISATLSEVPAQYDAVGFGLRSVWRPPSVADGPLFRWEAVGGVWSVPVCRAWRWSPGMRYGTNHNTPETDAGFLGQGPRMARLWNKSNVPTCLHMGFTASLKVRRAKHLYYRERGEGRTDRRAGYVGCRLAWETWRPGDKLPMGARVVPYAGPVPECFTEGGG